MSASKTRLDKALVDLGRVSSRSQAESYIKLGKVFVNGKAATKAGFLVGKSDIIKLAAEEQYVSRAGLKLASVAEALRLSFKGKVVLDVGSSTGGFTDYALRHGAGKVIAVDVGSKQLHPTLHNHPKIELHEQTDIRDVYLSPINTRDGAGQVSIETPDMVLVDVSFISLREVLPHIAALMGGHTELVAMLKPQFEAGDQAKHKGVIKNDKLRRDILKSFETWVQELFVIVDKADSQVAGSKGNRERFYLLKSPHTKRNP